MNNEEKFKNSVRDLLDEQYYPYDPSNWEEASLYLDTEDRRKRRGLFFLLAGLGLSIALTVYLLFPSGDEGTQNSLTKKQAEKIEAVTSAEAGENKTQGILEAVAPGAHQPVASSQAPENDPGALEQSPVSQPVVSPGSLPARQPVRTALNTKGTAGSVPSRSIPPLVAVKNETESKDKEHEMDEQVKQDVTSDDNSGVANEHPGDDPYSSGSGSQGLLPEVPATVTDQKQKEDQPEPVTHAEAGKQETKAADTSLTTRPKDLGKITLPAQLADTSVRPAGQSTIQNLPVSNYCYVEAGAYVNLGWTYQGVREGAGFNPYLGVSYLMRLTDKAGFSIGAYYTTLANLKLDTKVIKSSKIVFGEESDVVAITPVNLNYVSIPLRLQYTIDAKQMLTAGYSAGYLLDVQSKVETYTERLDMQENKKSYMTGGYVEGFKTFNSQLSMGYRRQIYKGLWGNAEIFYGLTDVRDDIFFGISRRERTTGLKISLTYDLIKK